jgi:hypothetical protein
MPYKDPDKIKQYQKEYRERNKDKHDAYCRKYYEEHKEEFAERREKYYEENREKLCEGSREYYREHKEEILPRMKEYHKKYYEENREMLLEKNRQHVKQHREKYTQYQRQKRLDRSEWLWELKCGLICVKCGEDHPACFDFHHIDPKMKDGLISKMIKRASMERVISEIEKCDVLCANCHRKLHCKKKIIRRNLHD